jgi:hypothetical protein
MVDPKEKQKLAAGKNQDAIRSEMIENAHASGDGSLKKSDDSIEETEDQEEPKDPPY